MKRIHSITFSSPLYPEDLRNIYDAPQQLRYIGDLEKIIAMPRLAIVGSRKVTPYGRAVTIKLAKEAAEQGIAIVSGLALGVDGLAHQATVDTGGATIAVLPNGLSKVYPASHHQLAERIIGSGGVLITEYPDEMAPFKTNFIARNRLVSGLSDAVLITEAAAKSGTLHTANFALEQGRIVMAVPGNITSELSAGTNNLIKAGALPVTDISDILSAMGLTKAAAKEAPHGATEQESLILQLIHGGISDSSELLSRSELSAPIFNQSLTMLEINGKVRPLGAGHWGLS